MAFFPIMFPRIPAPAAWLPVLVSFAFACVSPLSAQERKNVPVPENIPAAGSLKPRAEQPVFAVVSKQGMRILVSRDDGKTWKQTFLGTEEREDGGFHGQFAVYGMAYTKGVIGVFSGWGPSGLYLGSDDGVRWTHLSRETKGLQSVWHATAGAGAMLVTGGPWGGFAYAGGDFTNWSRAPIMDQLNKQPTHHFICGFGEHKGMPTFVAIGDGGHVFRSTDLGKTWNYARLPGDPGKGQNTVVYGNGVFLCDLENEVARSTDGGATWTLHPHGLGGKAAWRALSVVKGEFWLTGRGGKGARRSKDGIEWTDLPAGTPGGLFVVGESGTIINVERGRQDIRRSTDGRKWDTVLSAPAGTEPKDPTWSLAYAVTGKVNTVRN